MTGRKSSADEGPVHSPIGRRHAMKQKRRLWPLHCSKSHHEQSSEPVAFRRVYGLESYSRTSGESNHHQSVSDTRVPRFQLHHEDDWKKTRQGCLQLCFIFDFLVCCNFEAGFEASRGPQAYDDWSKTICKEPFFALQNARKSRRAKMGLPSTVQDSCHRCCLC